MFSDLNFTFENDRDDEEVPPVDFNQVKREAVRYADIGAIDQMLTLPDERKATVRKVIKRFHLGRLLRDQPTLQ